MHCVDYIYFVLLLISFIFVIFFFHFCGWFFKTEGISNHRMPRYIRLFRNKKALQIRKRSLYQTSMVFRSLFWLKRDFKPVNSTIFFIWNFLRILFATLSRVLMFNQHNVFLQHLVRMHENSCKDWVFVSFKIIYFTL